MPNNIEKEINKCSKCGLCKSICPIYKITKNDFDTARGKFILLKENKFAPQKILDFCLKCNKCKEYCPSNIDIRKISEGLLGEKYYTIQEEIPQNSIISPKQITVTFHKPCHFNKMKEFYQFINNCKNVNYIEMNNFDECCGMGENFDKNFPEFFEKIISQKIKNIKSTNADYVITTCPKCKNAIQSKGINILLLSEFASLF